MCSYFLGNEQQGSESGTGEKLREHGENIDKC